MNQLGRIALLGFIIGCLQLFTQQSNLYYTMATGVYVVICSYIFVWRDD